MARHAFVLGSNGSAGVGQLQFAADDAKRISGVLARKTYGFTVATASAPADPYQIKRELDLLAKSCTPADSFVFFFSGHGELIGGELMLVLDATVPGDVTTYLPVNWVKEARARCQANNRLLILDCCHAGGAVGGKAAASQELAELGIEAKNELMLLASQRLEIAREFAHLGGSFLTTELAKFLQGGDGRRVGLGQAMAHLRTAAESHNATRAAGVPAVPVPFLNGNQQGEFLFSGDSAYPDLSAFVTIRNQGSEGSPTSVAIVTAMETCYAIRGQQVRLSPRYVREKSRRTGQMPKGDVGERYAPVVFTVEQFGAPPEALWQYVAGKTERPAGVGWTKLDSEAGAHRARSYRFVGVDQIAAQLALNRPVLASVTAYRDAGWYEPVGESPGWILPPGPGAQLIGGHCITIVARTPRGFRFANSWGTGWGDQGFGELSYAAAEALIGTTEMWAVELMN